MSCQDDVDAFVDAIANRREPFPADWLLRPGGHCAAKGGLTTLWAFTAEEAPDPQGRRPSDVNAGTVITPRLAAAVADAYNARGKAAAGAQEACAAELRALMESVVELAPERCQSDPCPACTALEGMQSLALRWEGRV